MINYESRFSDELMHKGIRGMRWGDRNGPPYPLDRQEHKQVISRSQSKKENAAARAATKAAKEKAIEEKRQAKEYRKAFKKQKKAEKFRIKYEKKLEKQVAKREAEKVKRDKEFQKTKAPLGSNQLSNEELQERINRLQLESNYQQKMSQVRPPKKDGIIKSVLKKSATTALSTAATAALTVAGKEVLEKMFDTNRGLSSKEIMDRRRRSLDRYI